MFVCRRRLCEATTAAMFPSLRRLKHMLTFTTKHAVRAPRRLAIMLASFRAAPGAIHGGLDLSLAVVGGGITS